VTGSVTVQDSGLLSIGGTFDLNIPAGTGGNTDTVNLNGGTLAVGSFIQSGNASTNAQNAVIRFNGGTLKALANDTSSSVFFLPAPAVAARTTTNVDTGGAIINSNTYNITIANPLVHGTGTTDGGVTKNGAGTLTLTAANTYNGVTTINAGTLNINGINALGGANYAGTTFNGGTLQYAATTTSGTDISSATKPVTLSAGGATIDTNGNTVTYANSIGNSGVGALTKTGAGTLTLGAANTYSGNTTIGSGTVSVGTFATGAAAQPLGKGTDVNLGAATSSGRLLYTGAGGTLDKNINALGNGSDTIESTGSGLLTLSGNLVKNGTILTLKGGSNGIAVTGVISGASAGSDLVINGGTVTLSNANTYNGPTTITSGTLNATNTSGSATGSGAVAVNGGVLAGSGIISGTVTVGGGAVAPGAAGVNLTLGGLVYNSGSLTFSLDGAAVTSSSITTANATFNAAPTLTLNLSNLSSFSNGQTYTLLTSTNPIVDGGFLTGLPVTTIGRVTLTPAEVGNTIVVNATGSAASLVWAGGASGVTTGAISGDGSTWDNTQTNTVSGNWDNGGTYDYFYNQDTLTFDDTGSPNHTVSIVGTVSPGSVTVNTASSYTFANGGSGAIAGVGSLTVAGGGLNLNTVNTYSGGTNVNAGATLTTGAAGALPGTNTVTVAGTVDLGGFNQTIGTLSDGGVSTGVVTSGVAGAVTLTTGLAANSTYSGIIQDGSGNVAVTKAGSGKLTLTGANAYSGTTSVSAGVLNIQNATGLGTTAAGTSVTSGAALQIQGGITVGAESLSLNGTGVGATGALRNISDTNIYGGLVTLAGATRINSDAGTLTLSNAGTITGATFGLTVGGSGDTVINSIIGTTTGTLTKDGSGTLTLAGANTYSGTTTINAGTVSVVTPANTGTGGVTLNGGTFKTTGTTNAATTKVFTIGASGGTFNLANFTNPTNAQLYLNTANQLVGSGPLTIVSNTGAGIGNIRVAKANTYNGAITVQNGGNFEFGLAGAVTATANTGATFTVNSGGEIEVNTGVTNPAAITVNGGIVSFEGGAAGVYSGPISLSAGGATIGMRNWYNQATAGGSITGVVSGAGNLTLGTTDTTTSGAVTLSGANTYTGDTTIANGTVNAASIVVASGASNLGNSTNAVTLGTSAKTGTLNYTGGTAAYTRGFTVAAGGGILINAGSGTLNVDTGGVATSGTFTVNGASTKDINITSVISGSGGLSKTGANTVTLTEANTYTGATNIGTGGTLQLGNGGTTGVLSASSAITDNGNLTINHSNAVTQGTDFSSAAITGTGTLTQAGAGTTTLTAANTYSGGTTISAGSLQLGNGGTTGSLSVTGAIVDNGNLTINRSNAVVQGTAFSSAAITGTGSLTQAGSGTTTLNAANSYSGATTITGGTLEVATGGSLTGTTAISITGGTLLLSTDVAINNTSANVSLGTGGTLALSSGLGSISETLGTLTLSDNSTLDFGDTGTGNTLNFTNVILNGFTLTVAHWSGSYPPGATDDTGTPPDNQDRLLFSGLSLQSGDLDRISFTNDDGAFIGTGQQISFGGSSEIVPIAAVPEPTTILGGLALLGLVGYRERRRIKGLAASLKG
jgi:autotransporter-associated beta strand protein